MNHKNIVLIGFKAAGKTTVGKIISTNLNKTFVDIDITVEKLFKETTGISYNIRNIYLNFGESYFRNIEREAVKSLRFIKHAVISTGGGFINSKENIDTIKLKGIIVFLDVHITILKKRFENIVSPLFINTDLVSLYEKRLNIYKKHSDIIYSVDKEETPEITALNIIKILQK